MAPSNAAIVEPFLALGGVIHLLHADADPWLPFS